MQENLESPGWIDVSTMLSVSVSNDDVQLLLDSVLSGVKDALVFDTFIVHKSLTKTLRSLFEPLMLEKAAKVSSTLWNYNIIGSKKSAF